MMTQILPKFYPIFSQIFCINSSVKKSFLTLQLRMEFKTKQFDLTDPLIFGLSFLELVEAKEKHNIEFSIFHLDFNVIVELKVN